MKKILFISIILYFIYLIIFWIYAFRESFLNGEVRKAYNDATAMSDMFKIKKSLDNYKNINRHYPITQSKYFTDSLLFDLKDSELSFCIDTSIGNATISLQKKINSTSNRTYASIGNCTLFYIYKSINGVDYNLYYIGQNGIDENGKGDDIPLARNL